jgi:hypothetical protein
MMACCGKSNVGSKERGVRILVGAVLVTLAYTHQLGDWAWIGLIPLITGLIGYCPVYTFVKRRGCCGGAKSDDGGSCCK